jgi:RNA polymerase sigma-70 factor, ECF subfamily
MIATQTQPVAKPFEGMRPISGNPDFRDESWLVARAKSGHEDAFGELYERHRLKTYRTALRILRNQQDAEDAVQKAFHHALVNLQRFREDSTFSTWLTRIAINECLMLIRQRRTPEPLHEVDAYSAQGEGTLEIPDGGPTPEQILCERERRTALIQAIGRLRKNLRVVILHRELQGMTSAETARRLGLTVSAVKARTFHARRFLKKHLERNFESATALSKLLHRRA